MVKVICDICGKEMNKHGFFFNVRPVFVYDSLTNPITYNIYKEKDYMVCKECGEGFLKDKVEKEECGVKVSV